MGALAADWEEVVLERARGGDKVAMRQIYDSCSKLLAAVCSRYVQDGDELKDVMQEGFVKIFTSLDKFQYRGKGSLLAWMRQVMVNEALKSIRRRRKKSALDYRSELPETGSSDDPLSEPDVGKVPEAEIQRMIGELPDNLRTVFNLYVFEERSHREIGSMLGIAEGTSASCLSRAKALLVKKITAYKKQKGIE